MPLFVVSDDGADIVIKKSVLTNKGNPSVFKIRGTDSIDEYKKERMILY